MKILVYSNCPLDPALGSGKTRLRWSEGLRGQGHEVQVVEPADMEFWPGFRVGKRFRLALGAVRHARRALAAQSVDLVEIYGAEFGWLAAWLDRRKSRPMVIHHSDGCELNDPGICPGADPTASQAGGWRGRLHDTLNVPAFRRVDACVVGCEIDREFLRRGGYFPPERLEVVPPGVDEEFFIHAEPGPRVPRLAFLGSWIERKRVDVLAAAVAEVMAENATLEFDLFGTGRKESEIRAAFPEAVRARIRVAPRLATADLASRLAAASIFVFPSAYEGFGMATAEAMACGCAVITTRTGFGGDLRDGEDALLVPFGDRPALVAALRRLVQDDVLRLKIARAGWQRVQTNHWTEGVRRLDRAYRGWHAAGPVRHS